MTKNYCDRCGKESEIQCAILDHRPFVGFGRAELCNSCSKELFRWLFGKTEKLNPMDIKV